MVRKGKGPRCADIRIRHYRIVNGEVRDALRLWPIFFPSGVICVKSRRRWVEPSIRKFVVDNVATSVKLVMLVMKRSNCPS